MPSTPRRGTAGKDARPTPHQPSAARPTARRVARAAQGTGNREQGTGNRDPLTRAATAFVAEIRRHFKGHNPFNHAMFTWNGAAVAHFKALAKACGMGLALLLALAPLVGCTMFGGPAPGEILQQGMTVVVKPAVEQALKNGLQELQAQAAGAVDDPAVILEIEGLYVTGFRTRIKMQLDGVNGQIMTAASAAPPAPRASPLATQAAAQQVAQQQASLSHPTATNDSAPEAGGASQAP